MSQVLLHYLGMSHYLLLISFSMENPSTNTINHPYFSPCKVIRWLALSQSSSPVLSQQLIGVDNLLLRKMKSQLQTSIPTNTLTGILTNQQATS